MPGPATRQPERDGEENVMAYNNPLNIVRLLFFSVIVVANIIHFTF